jgi:hypothetical protein
MALFFPSLFKNIYIADRFVLMSTLENKQELKIDITSDNICRK